MPTMLRCLVQMFSFVYYADTWYTQSQIQNNISVYKFQESIANAIKCLMHIYMCMYVNALVWHLVIESEITLAHGKCHYFIGLQMLEYCVNDDLLVTFNSSFFSSVSSVLLANVSLCYMVDFAKRLSFKLYKIHKSPNFMYIRIRCASLCKKETTGTDKFKNPVWHSMKSIWFWLVCFINMLFVLYTVMLSVAQVAKFMFRLYFFS